MTEGKHTPGPWRVRKMERGGEVLGYFVAAPDVNGFAYDAEIMGEDEYQGNMERWFADACLIAAAPDMLELVDLLDAASVDISGTALVMFHGMNAREVKDRLRAALAKATGAS